MSSGRPGTTQTGRKGRPTIGGLTSAAEAPGNDPLTGEYFLHLFAKEHPDVNWESPGTRKALYASAMEFWLDRGVDGFRIDTVNMDSKPDGYPDAPILDDASD